MPAGSSHVSADIKQIITIDIEWRLFELERNIMQESGNNFTPFAKWVSGSRNDAPLHSSRDRNANHRLNPNYIDDNMVCGTRSHHPEPLGQAVLRINKVIE